MNDKAEVVQALVTMIAEVLGEDEFGIEADTSFKDGLGFQSIQFVALAELIQERWDDLDFVSWLQGMQMPQILALRVGDVADFIVRSQGQAS
jgi:acyl carrier protein